MYRGKKIGVIIAAAGRGSRMGMDIPKQFIPVQGETMLVRSVRAFAGCKGIDRIYVVTPSEYMEMTKSCLEGELTVGERKKIGAIISGGATRQQSVYRALTAIGKQPLVPEIMLVHDGARPYVSLGLISDVIKETVEKGSAVPGIKLTDTVRDGKETLDRDSLLAVQTPQGFSTADLINAYGKAEREGFQGTDDASLVERLGIKINCIPGESLNIKVTTPGDLREEKHVGIGYDVHRFEDPEEGHAAGAGRGIQKKRDRREGKIPAKDDREKILVLGGVIIPHERELLAHSDGDVLIHAIMDALLGAAGLGDIGHHFPDDDPEYKGASSMLLLRRVKDMLDERHYTVENIDAVIVCERPRIMPYRSHMEENVAQALRTDRGRINIKATTTEGLGFAGRMEGIEARAVCMISR